MILKVSNNESIEIYDDSMVVMGINVYDDPDDYMLDMYVDINQDSIPTTLMHDIRKSAAKKGLILGDNYHARLLNMTVHSDDANTYTLPVTPDIGGGIDYNITDSLPLESKVILRDIMLQAFSDKLFPDLPKLKLL